MVDTFENRLLYFINSQEDLGGTTWGKINDHLLHEMGYKPNPNLLHFKLKKLRNEGKVRFQQVGDLIFYRKVL